VTPFGAALTVCCCCICVAALAAAMLFVATQAHSAGLAAAYMFSPSRTVMAASYNSSASGWFASTSASACNNASACGMAVDRKRSAASAARDTAEVPLPPLPLLPPVLLFF